MGHHWRSRHCNTLARGLHRVTYALLGICLICLIVGMALLWRSHMLRQRTGLPAGQVVYVDTGDWQDCERPLFSSRHRLTGRPDYLVRQRGHIIPVEVKSATGLRQPYESHILQLTAYCLLVEENERKTPPYGLLHYPDVTFHIPYTLQTRVNLLDTLTRLRADLDSDDVPRSHSEPQRCRCCGFHRVCSWSL